MKRVAANSDTPTGCQVREYLTRADVCATLADQDSGAARITQSCAVAVATPAAVHVSVFTVGLVCTHVGVRSAAGAAARAFARQQHWSGACAESSV